MINIEDFCDKLEGFYDNWYQAAGNPAKYAHIKLTWERIGELEFKSKQWYQYLGEENPYRHRWHRIQDDSDQIVVENWSPDWKDRNKCCDMIFKPNGIFYKGAVATNNRIINGGELKSVVEFNGEIYKSRDQGWKNGKVIWGSNVIYEFQKSEGPICV